MSKIAKEFMNEWPDCDWGTAEDVSEYMLKAAAATADKLDGVMQGVADLLRELIKEIES